MFTSITKLLTTTLIVTFAAPLFAQKTICYDVFKQVVSQNDKNWSYCDLIEKRGGDTSFVTTTYKGGRPNDEGLRLRYGSKDEIRIGSQITYVKDTAIVWYRSMYNSEGNLVTLHSFYRSGKAKRIETYNADNKIVSGVLFSQDGSELPFTPHQQMPSYPGGDSAMMRFLKDSIQYPQLARENNIVGIVALSFVVDTTGSILNIVILKDPGGGCGQEARRVVRLMPKWNPGMMDDRPVKVKFMLPVKFNLESTRDTRKRKRDKKKKNDE